MILSLPLSALAGDLPVGGRAGGMGDAFIATMGGAACIYHNPAGIMFQRGISSDLTFGWSDFPFPANWSAFYVKPQADGSCTGMGFVRQRREKMEDTYRSFQALLPLTYSLGTSLKTGVNLKYITQKKAPASYKAKMSCDFGALLRAGRATLGFMARNFIDPGFYSFPSNLAFGAGIELGKINLEIDWFAGKWEEFNNEDGKFRIGAEIKLHEQFYIRGGWEEGIGSDLVSAGFTCARLLSAMKLDYCYRAENNDLSNGTHWLSYSYSTEKR